MRDPLELAPEVARALEHGIPVVALESSLLAHGLPHPLNLETARALEAIARAEGAVPATVGVVAGRIKIGLSGEDLGQFATRGDVPKVSRRDLSYALATGGWGATTVAATLFAAAKAGIRVFATGGIGGVHRGWQSTLDVSADLRELARVSVAVVCAGAKSILDLGATLEVLESEGVPVVGFGTGEFPAFYARSSGLALEHRLDSAADVARLMHAKWGSGLEGAIVVANPVPEAEAIDPAVLERHIAAATAAAERRGISGKELTPFLLERIAEETGGASLRANVALLKSNARLAAAIACAYAAGVS